MFKFFNKLNFFFIVTDHERNFGEKIVFFYFPIYFFHIGLVNNFLVESCFQEGIF